MLKVEPTGQCGLNSNEDVASALQKHLLGGCTIDISLLNCYWHIALRNSDTVTILIAVSWELYCVE